MGDQHCAVHRNHATGSHFRPLGLPWGQVLCVEFGAHPGAGVCTNSKTGACCSGELCSVGKEQATFKQPLFLLLGKARIHAFSLGLVDTVKHSCFFPKSVVCQHEENPACKAVGCISTCKLRWDSGQNSQLPPQGIVLPQALPRKPHPGAHGTSPFSRGHQTWIPTEGQVSRQ